MHSGVRTFLKPKKKPKSLLQTGRIEPVMVPKFDHILPKSQNVHAHDKYPYRQLKAIPFVCPPDLAANELRTYEYMMRTGSRMFSAALRLQLAIAFPSLHKWKWFPEYSTLEKLEMVYFPTWLVNGELKADVTVDNNGSKLKTEAVVHLKYTYIPGADTELLSTISLKHLRKYPGSGSDQLLGTMPVPFTDELRNQHGNLVTCLPFNIWPKRICEFVQEKEPRFDICGTSIQLTSLKPSMAVMFPILFPLYVAKFRSIMHSGEQNIQTMIMEAHQPVKSQRNRIFVLDSSIPPDMPKHLELKFANSNPYLRTWSNNNPSFTSDVGFRILGLAEQPPESALESLLEGILSDVDTPKYLAKISKHDKTKRQPDPLSTDTNDWNVREWDKATRTLLLSYMNASMTEIDLKAKATQEGKLNDPQIKRRLKAIEKVKKLTQLRKW